MVFFMDCPNEILRMVMELLTYYDLKLSLRPTCKTLNRLIDAITPLRILGNDALMLYYKAPPREFVFPAYTFYPTHDIKFRIHPALGQRLEFLPRHGNPPTEVIIKSGSKLSETSIASEPAVLPVAPEVIINMSGMMAELEQGYPAETCVRAADGLFVTIMEVADAVLNAYPVGISEPKFGWRISFAAALSCAQKAACTPRIDICCSPFILFCSQTSN